MTVGLLFLYISRSILPLRIISLLSKYDPNIAGKQLLSLAGGRQLAMICITENWREVGSQDIGAIVS